MRKNTNLPALQIVGQFTYHGNAEIFGTVVGLQRLRRIIDEAIKWGVAEADFFPSDGEGYSVYAHRKTDAEMLAQPTSYAGIDYGASWIQYQAALEDAAVAKHERAKLRLRVAELEAAASKGVAEAQKPNNPGPLPPVIGADE